MKIRGIILAILIIFAPGLLFAQASLSVPAEDRVYRAIDRLVAAGVVDDVIVGQRPYSRNEVARIFIEARRNFDRLKKPTEKMMAWRILHYWEPIYQREINQIKSGGAGDWRLKILDELDVYYYHLDGPDRQAPANGLGSVRAHVRPITEYFSGRHIADDFNFGFESFHSAGGPYFALMAHPLFQLQIRIGDAEPENKIYAQELYAKFGYKNFELEVGRDELIWGQGELGGLMFTNNARPLDFVKFSNPHPGRLPWVFRHIGNIKSTLFLANMGPRYNFKYAYLLGWKLSVQPATFAEVGIDYGVIMGGRGAPAISRASNSMGGIDLRFRIPSLSSVELYTELYFEDVDWGELGVTFLDRTAYIAGLYFPRLCNSNNMALRFEYHHTSPITYRNNQWTDGFALSNEFLGDPLGPNGDAVYANYYYDLGEEKRLIFRLAYERRGGDLYRTRASDGSFVVTTSRPTEIRYRGMVAFGHQIIKKVRWQFLLGYERVSNFNFMPGDGRHLAFFGTRLKFDLGL